MTRVRPLTSGGFPSAVARRFARWSRAAGARRNARRLASYRDQHAGERCFIIGNGPSLSITDLVRLSGETTFAANKIYLAFGLTAWRPTYYVAEDDHFLEQHHAEISRWPGFVKFVNGRWRHLFRGDREVIWYPWRPPDAHAFPRFSTDALRVLHCGYMVTYVSLQLAYWMGFSRVYLLGVDFDYGTRFAGVPTVAHASEHGRDHFVPNYFKPGELRYLPRLDLAEVAMRCALDAYRAGGRQVWNATPGGKLEVFERTTLDDVLRGEAG